MFVTGAEVLAFVGVINPTPVDTEWADLCASAINDGITGKLNGAAITNPPPSELVTAARIGAAECYKRKEAIFGLTGYADMAGNAVRVARDYLEGVKPIIDRYSAGPGIG